MSKTITNNKSIDTIINEYITIRFDKIIKHCEYQANQSRVKYYILKVITAIGAVIIPILNNLSLNFQYANSIYDVSKILITVIGLFVACSIALEEVFKFREKWTHSLSIKLYLEKELQFFEHQIGHYKKENIDESFKSFVQKVETAISEESKTLTRLLAQIDKTNSAII